jgi:hypothetical protein
MVNLLATSDCRGDRRAVPYIASNHVHSVERQMGDLGFGTL